MSSNSHAFAFWSPPENDESAIFSTDDSGYQPTWMTETGTYDVSGPGWDKPGAAFDEQFDAMDLLPQRHFSSENLSGNVSSRWTEIPSYLGFEPQVVHPRSNLRETVGFIADTIPGPHPFEVVEPSTLLYREDPISTALSTQSHDSHAEMTSAPGYVSDSVTMEIAGASQFWLPYGSVPLWQSERPDGPSNTWSPGIIVGDEQSRLGAVVDDQICDDLHNSSALCFLADFQAPSNRHLQTFHHHHVPTFAGPNAHALQRDVVQQTQSQDESARHKRQNSNTGDRVTRQHHEITSELPCQIGATVSASESQSAFHTFSISGQSVRQRTRKAFTKDRLAKVNAVRKAKACLNCRRAKAPVSIHSARDVSSLIVANVICISVQ